MSSPRISKVRGTLRRKLLIPMFLTGALFLSGVLWYLERSSTQLLSQRLAARGELVAHMVNYAAEIVDNTGELQRIVSATGGEADVDQVTVVGGDPLRVLACTKAVHLGMRVAELSDKELAEDLIDTIRSQRSHLDYKPELNQFQFSEFLLLTQPKFELGAERAGAVMVHLDTRSTVALVRTQVWITAGIFAVGLLIFPAAGLWLISRIVLRPISLVTDVISREGGGSDETWSQIERGDEIGELAHLLQTSLVDREAAVSDLKNQKFALDQHAIVSVTDLYGRMIYVNEKFAELTGYSSTELSGRTHRIVNSGAHPLEFFSELWGRITAGQVWRGEICNRNKSGVLFWVETTIVPLTGTDNKIHSYVAIQTDITERVKAKELLVSAKEAAEAANLAKSDFLSATSHEIRTPMNGVLGFADLLWDTNLDEKQRGFLDALKRSGESMLLIINDILDFSKIEAGRMDLCPSRFNLRTLAEEVGVFVSQQRRKIGVEFKLEYSLVLPAEIVGDQARWRQILLNLVGNAFKFTERGEIVLRLFEGKADSKRTVCVEVSDTGMGISRSDQQKLFHRFSQVDSGTTRRFGGTGLGLVISKRLVELMGGEIGLESEVGTGTKVWFKVPLEVPAAEPEKAGQPPRPQGDEVRQIGTTPESSEGALNLRVLVAEDNAVNKMFISALLKKLGCTADLVENGVEAVRSFEEGSPYDVILMDCHMPEMDGFAATERIRKLERERGIAGFHVPIVAVTASAMAQDHDRCLASGMDAVLTKPLRPPVLRRQLCNYIPSN